MTKLWKQKLRASRLHHYLKADATSDEKATLKNNVYFFSIGRRDILEAVATMAYVGAKQNKELEDILDQLKEEGK